MKRTRLLTAIVTLSISTGYAQIGIGTTTPAGALDITSATNGVLVPRVALTTKAAAAPVVNPQGGALTAGTLVWNTATAGVSPNNVIPGFYYWDGSAWVALAGINSNNWTITGNTGTNGGTTVAAGTNFIGTNDNQNLDVHTNNVYRARFSSLGEFFVGTLNTVITGDLMNAVGNTTFPWAVNGYTSDNGSGVYGSVQAGNTIYGGVQGEYYGSNAQGTGVRGIFGTTTAGTSFAAPASGVSGQALSSGTYKFGVLGTGGTTTRSGGVMGYNYGFNGALGYYANNGNDYDVYGFGLAYTTGVINGRSAQEGMGPNQNIGLGIYGGVMGGWVRGMKYGFSTKGETYSLYVDGMGVTNKPMVRLTENASGTRTASYYASGMKPEISENGIATLQSGKVYVAFGKAFGGLVSDPENIVITATPQGRTQGVYIDQVSREGFWVVENNDGASNTRIAWNATAAIKGDENATVSPELLSGDFDRKMDGVMFNDYNTTDKPQPLWWDGNQIRWDAPPAKDISRKPASNARVEPKN